MGFSAADFRDWINMLYEHPEWRDELRRLVLTDELLQLPALVRELSETVRTLAEEQRRFAEAQRRTDEAVRAS
ncbi:MAG: hypothetical protein NZ693_06200 [Thermoflexales bacterium]|nr:hypothetical protein [Thermoflexales bacterium]